MERLAKNKQNRETISRMMEKYFSPLKMKNYRELTEGYFNIAYEIHLSNEEQVILKIAPLKEVRVMTYEKISIDQMWLCLDRDKTVFEEVSESKLVHWDCWDGNIFIHSGKVTGIIDWERSIWGDPLMEVGFRTYADNICFQKGYGIRSLTENQERRALWYDIYLMLLLHWSTNIENMKRWTTIITQHKC